jgi:hypothetical protein
MGSREVLVRSDFLFAQPGFLYGLSRFFDFAGIFDSYNISRDTNEADARATFSDWHIIGADISSVLDMMEVDPSLCCDESKQLSLFSANVGTETTREFQKTA